MEKANKVNRNRLETKAQHCLADEIDAIWDWIFKHNNPPEWLHQELEKKIIKHIGEAVGRNIDKK